MNIVQRLISREWRPGRAALAGLIATIAYSLAMEGDILLVGNRFSDVRFIEGLLAGEKQSRPLFFLSWAIHILNGVALGELYGAVLKRYLPGPNWLKGVIFGEVFIVSECVVADAACRQISSLNQEWRDAAPLSMEILFPEHRAPPLLWPCTRAII